MVTPAGFLSPAPVRKIPPKGGIAQRRPSYDCSCATGALDLRFESHEDYHENRPPLRVSDFRGDPCGIRTRDLQDENLMS